MLGPGRIEASYFNRGETCLWPADRRPNEAIAPFCAHLGAGGIDAALALGIPAPHDQVVYSTIRVIESTYAERST